MFDEIEIPGLPLMIRDQPDILWMKQIGNRIVVKVKPEFSFPITRDCYGVYTFDLIAEKLRPVILHDGRLIDFTMSDNKIYAICRNKNQVNLLSFSNNTWKIEALPDGFPNIEEVRIAATGNRLVLFFLYGAYVRDNETWWPFQELHYMSEINKEYGIKNTIGWSVPECILTTDESIYAGYNSGEWGGNIFQLHRNSIVWRSCFEYKQCTIDKKQKMTTLELLEALSNTLAPPTGLIRGPDNHVWLATGLAHLGGLVGALYEFDGRDWRGIIPGRLTLPEKSDLTGIAFSPSGDLYILAGSIGLLKIKDNALLPVRVNCHEYNIPTGGLIIDPKGRIFIGAYDAGIITSRVEKGEMSFTRLIFDRTEPPVYVEDFIG